MKREIIGIAVGWTALGAVWAGSYFFPDVMMAIFLFILGSAVFAWLAGD